MLSPGSCPRFCKPLDGKLVRQIAAHHPVIITVEEGSIGGFGSHGQPPLPGSQRQLTDLSWLSQLLPAKRAGRQQPGSTCTAAMAVPDARRRPAACQHPPGLSQGCKTVSLTCNRRCRSHAVHGTGGAAGRWREAAPHDAAGPLHRARRAERPAGRGRLDGCTCGSHSRICAGTVQGRGCPGVLWPVIAPQLADCGACSWRAQQPMRVCMTSICVCIPFPVLSSSGPWVSQATPDGGQDSSAFFLEEAQRNKSTGGSLCHIDRAVMQPVDARDLAQCCPHPKQSGCLQRQWIVDALLGLLAQPTCIVALEQALLLAWLTMQWRCCSDARRGPFCRF